MNPEFFQHQRADELTRQNNPRSRSPRNGFFRRTRKTLRRTADIDRLPLGLVLRVARPARFAALSPQAVALVGVRANGQVESTISSRLVQRAVIAPLRMR